MSRPVSFYTGELGKLATIIAWIVAMIAVADRLQPGAFPQ